MVAAVDIFGAFSEGSKLVSRREDDMFDRLSNRWSVALIFAIALLITSYSYIGDPIDCYEPQEFEDQWVEYMDNICWVQNTYFVPFNQSQLPGPKESTTTKEIQYYQWVPMILAVQAILFMLPGFFWNFASDSAGYNVKDIVDICRKADSLNPDTRDASIEYLTNNMVRFINYRKPYKSYRAPIGKRYGRYVFIIYMFTKCLYIVNACLQIKLIAAIVGGGGAYDAFGWRTLQDLIKGEDGRNSPVFPKVAMCSFEIRRLGANIHRYTVQCLLSVNLFNEKAYFVIWWWLVFVAAMSVLGLILWLITSTTTGAQKSYVAKYLKIMKKRYDSDELDEFVRVFLRTDGTFTLRLIAKNTNDVVAGEVVAALWEKYLTSTKRERSLLSGEENESIA